MIAGVATGPLLSRLLGLEGFGTYTWAVASMGILGIFLDLGLSNLVVTKVSADHGAAIRFLGTGIVLKLVIVVIIFALLSGLVAFEVMPLLILFPLGCAFIQQLLRFYSALCRAHMWMLPAAVIDSTWSIAVAMVALTCLICGRAVNPRAILGASIVTGGTGLLLALIALRKRLSIARSWEGCVRALKTPLMTLGTLHQTIPFASHLLAGFLQFNVNALTLQRLAGSAATAHYGAGLKLIMLVGILPQAVYDALLPVSSRNLSSSRNSDASWAIGVAAFSFLHVAILVTCGVSLVAAPLLEAVFGTDFRAGDDVLRTLFLMLPLRYLTYFFGLRLTVSGYQRQRARGAWGAAVVNGLFSLLLIPALGAVGASIAAALGTAFLAAFYWVSTVRLDRALPFGSSAMGAAMLCTAIVAPTIWVRPGPKTRLVVLVLAAVVSLVFLRLGSTESYRRWTRLVMGLYRRLAVMVFCEDRRGP
jgi:O-antigen/teichoic acid export membrane protein